jgi:hypothetical protein
MTTPRPHKYENEEDATKVDVIIDDKTFQYPSHYGFNNCVNHDEFTEPKCADADGKPLANPEPWCGDSWCFIDKEDCTGLKKKDGTDAEFKSSVYFEREG